MITYKEIKSQLDPIVKKLHANSEYCECSKCNGVGRLDGFSNVAGGVCFKCNGKGKFPKNSAAKIKNKILTNAYHLLRNSKLFGESFDFEKSEYYIDMIAIVDKLPKKYKK